MAGNPATAPNAGDANNQNPAGEQNQQQSPPAQAPGINPQPATQQPASQPAPAPFIMSQEQFDARWAEKMGALEKELSLQPGGLKAFIEAQKKPKHVPAESRETLTGADLKIAKMEALMNAGVPSQKIPKLLKRIGGKTREEIEADILEMKADGFLTFEDPKAAQPQQQLQQAPATTPIAAQGAGNTGVPAPGVKTFTESQIAKMSREDYEANREDIMKAMEAGTIKKG